MSTNATSHYKFQIVLIQVADTTRLSDDKHKEGTEIESFSTSVLKYKTLCVPLVTWIRCKQISRSMAEIYGQQTGQNTDFKFHIIV